MSSALPDPRDEATDYLKKHRILQLFEELGAFLVLEKPKDPEGFLINKLEEIKESRKRKEKLTFFNAEDVMMMFETFDPTGKGYVTSEQYKQALKNLGIDEPKVKVSEGEKISKRVFESQVMNELISKSITAPQR